jgi:hypothetical protein
MKIVNDEMERTSKDVVAACYKALFKFSAGGTEESHENFSMAYLRAD